MARTAPRPAPTADRTLRPLGTSCPLCRQRLRNVYFNYRTISTLTAVLRLRLQICWCTNRACERYRRPYRPEEEGRLALPVHEFGLDVVALIGALRYRQHRTVPEIHRELCQRGVVISERSVTNLLDRYDELLALSLADRGRLQRVTREHGRVILALDGLQPDVGHEVLWVLRDCLSGEVLLARCLLSATQDDLAALLREVRDALPVPIAGVVSDGQHSIRKAVAKALSGVPHQLCHFHYLREAARPIYEADRHAKKELKKRVRGVRPIERAVEGRSDPQAEVIAGYCAGAQCLNRRWASAVRGSGVEAAPALDSRGQQFAARGAKRGLPPELTKLRTLLERGLKQTQTFWPAIRAAYAWVHRAAHILKHAEGQTASQVRRRYATLIRALKRSARRVGKFHGALQHFVKVTRSYWPGLFACYDVPDLPRTNNALEQFFGAGRYHERRVRGTKAASPGLVLRGSVRLVAAAATRLRAVSGPELAPTKVEAWKNLRHELEKRRRHRAARWRFRRDPAAYLTHLERELIQLILLA